MTTWAIVDNDTIVNVILADAEPNGVEAIELTGPMGIGWTRSEGDWSPPTPPQSLAPRRVTKADFTRLFEATERYALNALRREIAALTPADYTDPTMTLLIAAEDVLFAFEQPAEFIELDHPETRQGLELLAYLGVLTSERVEAIIAA